MDARAQLALLAKAKAVFERPGYFLSFPALTPISFAPAAMDFNGTDPTARAALVDFSRLVNLPPTGVLFDGQGDDYLWETYDRWLNAMQLATDTLPPADQARLDAALALLQDKDADGLATDSAAVVVYKACRDAWLNAQQAYKAAQMTATSSTDASVTAAWISTDEPRLRQAVVDAETNWEATGHKADVDAARGTVSQLQAHLPHVAWTAWRTAFQPDLDLLTDAASNDRFGPSGYAPGDVVNQPWMAFTLTGDEIASLVGSAPPELANLLTEDAAPTIRSISLEVRSAAVVRPWFDSSPFGAKFWRFSDGEPELSDGKTPPAGAWPAYISGVVFARNIKVVQGDAASAPTRVATLPPLFLRAEVAQSLQRVPPPAPAPPSPPLHIPPQAGSVWRRPMGPAGGVRFAPRMVMAERVGHSAMVASLPPSALATAVNHPPIARAAFMSPANRLMIATRPIGVVMARPTATSPPAPAPPAPAVDDRVSILAFICTPMPKSPDPDPSLQW